MGVQGSLCSNSSSTPLQTDASNTIEFDGQKFIVPSHINFQKQATFSKIQSAAKSFCNANRMNIYYYPVVARMIAYRHEKIFLAAWSKLPPSKRQDFLQDLTHVQHDLMDSFYHHYFKKDRKLPKKSLKNSQVLVPSQVSSHLESEAMAKLGKSLLMANKVGVVLMCAGYSSRFDKEDKFLCPINLYEKVTILDLMMRRLRRNICNPSEMNMVINCNELNRYKIEKHLQQKSYYGFNPHNVHLLINFALPIFDQSGEYCFNREVSLIKRSSGTINCAQQIINGNFHQTWKHKGVEYVYFTGAENLLENPCDPAFIGRLVFEKKKVGTKCVKPQYFSEPMCRYYNQSAEYTKILESRHFDQVVVSVLDKLPIAMNSMIFQLETLRRIVQDYASNISLAQYYQQLQLKQQISNFSEDSVQTRKCFNFEKDIRYLVTCVKEPLLYKVARGSEFAPVCSKDGEYSFNEAVNHYKDLLSKQLAQLSS